MASTELEAEPATFSAWWTAEVGRVPTLPFDGPAVPRDLERDDLTGAVIVLRAHGSKGETIAGSASVAHDEGHRLIIAGASMPVSVGAPVAVVRLAAKSSIAVPTTVVAQVGNSLVLDVLRRVCRVDQRGEIRHRITSPCTFSSGTATLTGATINVSRGGAMIAVSGGSRLSPGTTGLLAVNGGRPNLATVLHTTSHGDGWLLRLSFASPS
ncbi:MAG: PilZ domain-containing protein [Actinomycetota bacterium]